MPKLTQLKMGQEVQISFVGKGWFVGTLKAIDFSNLTAKLEDAFPIDSKETYEGVGLTVEGAMNSIYVYPKEDEKAEPFTWSSYSIKGVAGIPTVIP